MYTYKDSGNKDFILEFNNVPIGIIVGLSNTQIIVNVLNNHLNKLQDMTVRDKLALISYDGLLQ